MVSNSSITYIFNNKTESKTIKLLFYTYITRVKILHALFNHLYDNNNDNNNVITK